MENKKNKKINIVIPMAGAGSRFKVAGYNIPKPFIEFDGKMMIEHVLSSFENINANFILVVQEKFLKTQKIQLEKLKKNYKVGFTTVPKLTMGAAITALSAHKKINPDYDILIADADNLFNKEDIDKFIKYVRNNELNGALLTFNSNEPCFSYAKTDKNGYLIKTKEKEVISNHAICGVYYFKKLEFFMDSVIDLIVESDLSKGEYYMSNVFNHLLKTTKKIAIFDIKSFHCVGTPEQLKEYLTGEQND